MCGIWVKMAYKFAKYVVEKLSLWKMSWAVGVGLGGGSVFRFNLSLSFFACFFWKTYLTYPGSTKAIALMITWVCCKMWVCVSKSLIFWRRVPWEFENLFPTLTFPLAQWALEHCSSGKVPHRIWSMYYLKYEHLRKTLSKILYLIYQWLWMTWIRVIRLCFENTNEDQKYCRDSKLTRKMPSFHNSSGWYDMMCKPGISQLTCTWYIMYLALALSTSLSYSVFFVCQLNIIQHLIC